MSEPTYRYVKGQGWVPSVDEIYSGIREHGRKRYKITVIRRPPVLGERGWFVYSDNYPLKDVYNSVSWQTSYHNGERMAGFAWYCDDTRISAVEREPHLVVTVVTELIE